jgi:acetoacetate decarboxylase
MGRAVVNMQKDLHEPVTLQFIASPCPMPRDTSAAPSRLDAPLTRTDHAPGRCPQAAVHAGGGPQLPGRSISFIDREFLVITYETEPELIRAQLPEPLEPIEQPLVHYEWIKMPDSSGFGSYTESGTVIPARLRGEEVNFVSQMYLDDDPPIAAGREIWGFPKKYAHPKLEIVKDTLTGTLEYAGQLVATMGYKHESMAGNGERTTATLSRTQVNLKLIPGVGGHPEICQLVAINLTNIVVKGSWIGPGRLHLDRMSTRPWLTCRCAA